MYLLFGRTNNDCITFFFHFTHDNENIPFPIDGNLWYNTKPLVFHLYLFDDSNRTFIFRRVKQYYGIGQC